MKRLFSRIFALLILLAIIAGLVYAFLPQPVLIEVAAITRGPLRVTVDEDGRTRIREKYIVSAPLAGQLQRIQLRAGDTVTTGDTVIARINPGDPTLLDARALAEAEARVRRAEAAVRQTDADLERTRAEMDFAEDDMARLRSAAERGAATPREVDLAVTTWRAAVERHNAAHFSREIARFERELAEAALIRSMPDDPIAAEDATLLIRAPIDGSVLRVFQESTAVIQPGTPLIELGDPTDLEIVVDVLSTDAVRIPPGAPVIIEYWGGDTALDGRVRLIEPQAFTKVSALGVEEQRVNIIIDFINPPEDRATLGDAYRIEARIVIWEHDAILRIPTSALFRTDGEWAVYTIADGRATLRRVTIGRQSGLTAELLDGLNEGDTVILHPGDRIEDGTRVELR